MYIIGGSGSTVWSYTQPVLPVRKALLSVLTFRLHSSKQTLTSSCLPILEALGFTVLFFSLFGGKDSRGTLLGSGGYKTKCC